MQLPKFDVIIQKYWIDYSRMPKMQKPQLLNLYGVWINFHLANCCRFETLAILFSKLPQFTQDYKGVSGYRMWYLEYVTNTEIVFVIVVSLKLPREVGAGTNRSRGDLSTHIFIPTCSLLHLLLSTLYFHISAMAPAVPRPPNTYIAWRVGTHTAACWYLQPESQSK